MANELFESSVIPKTSKTNALLFNDYAMFESSVIPKTSKTANTF